MTDDAFRRTIANAAAVVRSWPAWKRNLLSHSASPTVSVPRQPVDNSGLQRKERDPMTDLEMIDELTKLEAAATPLPWLKGGPYPGVSVCVEVDSGCRGHESPEPPVWEPVAILDNRINGEPCKHAECDAAVIIASRNHLPRLLALARRAVELEAENARLRAALTNIVAAGTRTKTFTRYFDVGPAESTDYVVVSEEAEIARAALATPQDGTHGKEDAK